MSQVLASTEAACFARASSHDARASLFERGGAIVPGTVWWHELPELRGQVIDASESSTLWHRARANGERTKFERVAGCGTKTVQLVCPRTGRLRDEVTTIYCGLFRYCYPCRKRRVDETCARLLQAREVHLDFWSRELNRHNGFAFSERFITLTVAHSGSAALDFDRIQKAMPRFLQLVRDYLQEHARPKLTHEQRTTLPVFRSMELTGTGAGHAHTHLWTIGPFVPHFVLRQLWGRALHSHYVPVRSLRETLRHELRMMWPLERAPVAAGLSRCARCDVSTRASVAAYKTRESVDERGKPLPRERMPVRTVLAALKTRGSLGSWQRSKTLAELAGVSTYCSPKAMRLFGGHLSFLPWPVLDVRRATKGVEAELVKYVTKDLAPDGSPMDPFEYAQLVEATEGRRLVCTSRHFWRDDDAPGCPCCARPWVRMAAAPEGVTGAHSARGPPQAALLDTTGITVTRSASARSTPQGFDPLEVSAFASPRLSLGSPSAPGPAPARARLKRPLD